MSRELMQQALEALLEVNYDQAYAKEVAALRQALETKYKQARSLTDELMDCVDRLGSEADTVDPRVWQHLLVYAPKHEEEPVAWISDSPTKGNGKQLHWTKSEAWRWSSNITPLYTAPPKKEWVGLTDEEIALICGECAASAHKTDDISYARAIEAKLKEKNT